MGVHSHVLLTIVEEGRARSVEVAGPRVTLGRGRRNEVVLDAEHVSGEHLRLRVTPRGQLLAEDLGSSNGSAVQSAGGAEPTPLSAGEPIVVQPGDTLYLGARETPVAVAAEVVPHSDDVEPRLAETIRAERSAREVELSDVEPATLATLLGLNQELLRATTVEAVVSAGLATILDLVAPATHASAAFFSDRGESGRRTVGRVVQLRRGDDRPGEAPPSSISRTVLDRLPLDKVVTEQVGLLWSVEGVPTEATPATVRSLSLSAVACAPLWVGDEVLGVVQADVRGARDGDLEASHLDRLLVMAGPLALAIRNAQAIERVTSQRNDLAAENVRLRMELSRGGMSPPVMVGGGAAMARLRQVVSRVAPSDLPVLVTGETGTGKELVARQVHYQSSRSSRPFVASNVATLPPEIVEAELFGAAKGAYTGADATRDGLFAAADGGTLFLDEIGDLQLGIQVKLLRTIQEGEYRRVGETKTRKVDARLVAATNRDLAAAVEEGTFRQDLLFRINTVSVEVPPLRDRREDIPALIEHLLERVCHRQGAAVPELTDEVRRLLGELPWPGNVRQLENELARAVALTPPGEPVTAAVLSPEGRGVRRDPDVTASTPGHPTALKEAVSSFEREYVRAALAAHDGNRTHTAKALSLTRAGLQKLIKRHGLQD